MNDLRSRSRSLAAVSDDDASPRSTPPRVRPEEAPVEQRSSGQRMSRRQSIEERARREAQGSPNSGSRNGDQQPERSGVASASGKGQRLTKKQRRAARAAQRAKDRQDEHASQNGENSNGQREQRSDQQDRDTSRRKPVVAESENGVTSRPNRRRETEEVASDEEKFPWHFQFDDDEPDQLQASSPLLSRAFRATIG